MSKADVLDFDSLDTEAASEQPFELELIHPSTKKPLGVFVGIIGVESPEIKASFRSDLNKERMKEFQAARSPNKAVEPKTIEEQEADTIKLAVKLTKSWRTVLDGKSEPVIYWKGETLAFNTDNVTRWLTSFAWARSQIVEGAGEIGNFLKN